MGTVGGVCYPNATCNAGLECVRGICVPGADHIEPDASAPGPEDVSAEDVQATAPPTSATEPDTTTADDTTPTTAPHVTSSDTTTSDDTGPSPVGGAGSAQIDAVRQAPPGPQTPGLSVDGVVVTRVVLAEGLDPAGFFVQAERKGPAMFVAVDPASLADPPAAGDVVDFRVLATSLVSRQVRATQIDDLARVGRWDDLASLAQDLSQASDIDNAAAYESELVIVTATVAGLPAPAGPGHSQWHVTTTASGGDNLRLRLPDSLAAASIFAAGCRVRIGPSPLWRFMDTAELQVYDSGDLTVLDCPSDKSYLIFSEYIDGSASNKALEIANLGVTPFDLGRCTIVLYSNGSLDGSVAALPAATLVPGGVHVLCDPSGVPELLALCDTPAHQLVGFNGNDALELRCDGLLVDSIGQIGVAPLGGGWSNTAGDITTDGMTLRRSCGVMSGDVDSSDVFDPGAEWEGFPLDTFDGLGAHCR